MRGTQGSSGVAINFPASADHLLVLWKTLPDLLCSAYPLSGERIQVCGFSPRSELAIITCKGAK